MPLQVGRGRADRVNHRPGRRPEFGRARLVAVRAERFGHRPTSGKERRVLQARHSLAHDNFRRQLARLLVVAPLHLGPSPSLAVHFPRRVRVAVAVVIGVADGVPAGQPQRDALRVVEQVPAHVGTRPFAQAQSRVQKAGEQTVRHLQPTHSARGHSDVCGGEHALLQGKAHAADRAHGTAEMQPLKVHLLAVLKADGTADDHRSGATPPDVNRFVRCALRQQLQPALVAARLHIKCVAGSQAAGRKAQGLPGFRHRKPIVLVIAVEPHVNDIRGKRERSPVAASRTCPAKARRSLQPVVVIRGVGELALRVQPRLVAQTDAVARPFLARVAFATNQAARDVDHAPQARSHAVLRDVEILVARFDFEVRRLIAPGQVVDQPAAIRRGVAAVVTAGRSAAGAVDVDAIHSVEIGGRIPDHVASRAEDRQAAHVAVGERRLVGPRHAALDDIVAAAPRAGVHPDAPAVQVSPAIANHAALPVDEEHAPDSARRFLAIMQQPPRAVAGHVDPLDHHAARAHQVEAVRRQHRHAVVMGGCQPHVRRGHVEFPSAGIVKERAGDEL